MIERQTGQKKRPGPAEEARAGRMRRLCEDRGLEFYFLPAGGPYHSGA